MTEAALSRDVENTTIDENQNIVKMSDIASNTVVDFSNPVIREQLLNIAYEQSQYASEKVKSAVPDYESDLFTRISEGFKGAGKQLIKIPEQAQIIGGEALISIGGIAGFEKTEKLGKSIVQSAVKDLDFKNRFIYDTSIKTSDKDRESFSYMLGSGLEQFGEAILLSLVNPVAGAAWVGSKEVGSEIEEGVQVYREKTGDLNLDKIDKSFATKEIVGATTLGIVNGFIERIGGAPKQISIVKQPLRKTSLNILKGIAYEGGTEFLQELTNIGIDLADGTIDVSMLGDAMKQALMEGAVGGIIGGANTTIASIGNKRIAKKIIMDEFKNTVPTKDLNNFADAVYESADYSMKKIVANELVVSEELRNKHGDIFNSFLNESLKAMKESGGYEGVSEADLAQYATETAKQFADEVLSEANKRKVFIEDVISSKDIIYKDGELRLVPTNVDNLVKQARNKKQSSLLTFLINNGGLKNQNGELSALDAIKGRPGLVNNKNGLDLDRAREIAEEAGYFGISAKNNPGGTTIDDLLTLIDKELRGEKVYTEQDSYLIQQRELDSSTSEEEIAYLDNKLYENGIDYEGLTIKEKREAVELLKRDVVDEEGNYIEDGLLYDRNGNLLFQELPEGAYDAQGKADINTPEFKNWFGDSKIVDENGKPLVVYHGTDADFDTFDKSKQKRGFYGQGFYFSNDEETTRHYGKNTIPVYLSIKKPLEGVSSKELRNNLEKYKKQGYDGTIHRYNDGTITYSVFEPNQIKSVYNRGSFGIVSEIDISNFNDDVFKFEKGFEKRKSFNAFADELGYLIVKSGDFSRYIVLQSERSEATYLYLYQTEDDYSPRIKIRIATHAPINYASISDFYYDTKKTIKENIVDLNNLIAGKPYGRLTTGKDQKEMISRVYGDDDLWGVNFNFDGLENNYFGSTIEQNNIYYSTISDNIYEKVGGLPKQKKTRKGMFDASKKTIKLFENADFSTLPHELAHFWLDNMWTYANSGNASQSYLNQFQAVKDFLGMTTSYPTRQQHEKFATAYEKYIFKGELPTPAIKSSFDDYERWLRNIYNNISDIKQSGTKKVKLTPEIVKFFDSMLKGGVDVTSANKQILEEKAKEDTKKYDEEITPKAVEFIKEEQRVLNENIEKSPELKSKLMMPNQTGDKTGYLTAYKKMMGEDVEAGSIVLKDNYEKAVDYVNKNPVEADKIVKGEMDSPVGIEKNLIYLAYGEQQKAIGNTENRAIAAMNQALELRAAGQKIASQRLAYNESIFESYTNPTYWIETVENNKAEQVAKKAKMTALELEQKIESAIKSGMKQNKTAEEISQELAKDLGIELYQTDYEVDKTYDTKLSGYNEIYKYVNERIGKTLSLEEAQQITKMSDDLYSSLENLKDENGNPSVLYFKKLSELEAYANSLSPSSAYKILTEFMAPANLVASVKTPFVNIVSNIFGGSLEAVNRRAKYGTTSSIVSKQKESAFKQYSKDVFEATGYNVSTMSGDSFEKSILGEKIAHLEGKTDKFTNELRRVGKIYETIVFKYGLGKFDQISKDFAFVDSVSLQATKLSNGNVDKANAIFDDAILIEPKTETGKSVRQQAITDALIAVYQNNGVLSDFSIAVRNNMNKVIPGLGRFYIPFAKTPGNVIGLCLETFLPAKQIYNTIVQSVKNKKPTINKNDRGSIARSVTAYAISAILGFGLLDDDDYMPPYVLASQTDRNLARELNIPFNSIRVGKTWYSLDFAGPFASVLSGFLQAKRSDSMSGGILNFLVSGTMQGLSVPAIGGVSSIAEQGENIIQKVRQKKEGKIIKEAGIDFVDSVYSRMVPAIVSDIANAIDFYDRDAEGFEKLARKIPFLRNMLNEKINLTSGEAEEFGIVSSLFDVFAGSRAKAQIVNNVANELFRLNNAGYGVNLATPTRSGDLSKLDDDTKYMALKDFAELYSEKVDKLISRDSYLRKSDEDKKEMINKVRSDVLRRIKFKYRKEIKSSQT